MRNLPVIISALLFSVAARAEVKVAVLPVQAKADGLEKTAELLTDYITTEASKRKDLKVVGTNEMKTLVSFEQQRSLLGCTDDSCLAEVGAALGVDMVLTGSIGTLGDSAVLNLTLQDIRKVSVVGRVSEVVDGGVQKMLPLLPYMVGTVLQGIPGGPPPPARPDATAKPSGKSAPAAAQSAQPVDNKEAEGKSSSSLVRRVAGLAVAGVGGVMLLAGVALGVASVGYFAATRVGPAASALGSTPIRYVGFGIAGGADGLGILAALVLVTGVIIAVIP